MNIKIIIKLIILTSLFQFLPISSIASPAADDLHYSPKGFFDIHVCNWPDRPLFFLALFSTKEYAQLDSVSVFNPEKKLIAKLNLSKFRIVKNKGQAEKHVFLKQIPIAKNAKNGIYTAKALFKDGSSVTASDHVYIKIMPITSQPQPRNDEVLNTIPTLLKWQAVEGAKYYQVFIRDMWQEGKLIYQSPLLNQAQLDLKKSILKPGGLYKWRIHARDINEDILLGDFNHGSLSSELVFSINE